MVQSLGKVMRRRDFITGIGGSAVLWPLAARAQSERVRRIGVLVNRAEDTPDAHARLNSFKQGLEQHRWSEGHNIRLDIRYGNSRPELYQAHAKELVASQPDIIFAHTTPVVAALKRETSTIPIVFVSVSDPIGSGFITSMARPGGNVTGLMLYEAEITGEVAVDAQGDRAVACARSPDCQPQHYTHRLLCGIGQGHNGVDGHRSHSASGC